MRYPVRFRLRCAFRAFAYRFRLPLIHHYPTWGRYDHDHICLAARLLSPKEFSMVCPAAGGCDAETDDVCDSCPYLRTISFWFRKGIYGFSLS